MKSGLGLLPNTRKALPNARDERRVTGMRRSIWRKKPRCHPSAPSPCSAQSRLRRLGRVVNSSPTPALLRHHSSLPGLGRTSACRPTSPRRGPRGRVLALQDQGNR